MYYARSLSSRYWTRWDHNNPRPYNPWTKLFFVKNVLLLQLIILHFPETAQPTRRLPIIRWIEVYVYTLHITLLHSRRAAFYNQPWTLRSLARTHWPCWLSRKSFPDVDDGGRHFYLFYMFIYRAAQFSDHMHTIVFTTAVHWVYIYINVLYIYTHTNI